MQANSLTIFIIRQTIRECQWRSQKNTQLRPDTVLALALKANKSQKLLRHLKVWFYENEDKQIFKKIDTNTQTSNN